MMMKFIRRFFQPFVYVPICCYWNRIQDSAGNWINRKITTGPDSNVILTHGICGDCLEEHYSDLQISENDV